MTRAWFRVGIVLGSALLSGCTGELESTNSPAPGTGASGGTTSAPPAGSPPGSPQSSGGTSTASGGATPLGSGGAPSSAGAPPSGAGAPPSGGAGAPTTTAVTGRVALAARISKVEYANSVSDVLGTTLTAAELDAPAGGIPDDAGDGVFKHIADKQTSVEQHALSYFQVAEAVVKRVDIAALTASLGCSQATAECGTKAIAALGRRLYRRPLTQRESDAMLSVFNAAVAEELDFSGALRWTLQALLQAPQFLFRMDEETRGTAGQARDLSSLELAARLASFIWVSLPDDALLARAEDGSLSRPDVLESEVQRMLADPKAQRLTRAFVADFSRARFASFEGVTETDRAALDESITATFQDHLWAQKGSIASLFTTTRFVVNPRVAELLGIPMPGSGLMPVDVSMLPQRVGLLAHPGMIAGMGDRATGSFVNRGKYLMERLLCRNPGAVPASLLTELETFNANTTGFNEHERAAVRKTRGECWGCHTQFEPFAFGFSRFDGAGRYIGEQDAAGKPLPLDGWVPTKSEADSPHYTDFASYMKILASEPVIQTCMTEHFIAFATARTSDEQAKLEATRVGEKYIAGGSTLGAMVSAVVQSQLFRTIVPLSATSATNSGSQP
jgi:hypothetical protein